MGQGRLPAVTVCMHALTWLECSTFLIMQVQWVHPFTVIALQGWSSLHDIHSCHCNQARRKPVRDGSCTLYCHCSRLEETSLESGPPQCHASDPTRSLKRLSHICHLPYHKTGVTYLPVNFAGAETLGICPGPRVSRTKGAQGPDWAKSNAAVTPETAPDVTTMPSNKLTDEAVAPSSSLESITPCPRSRGWVSSVNSSGLEHPCGAKGDRKAGSLIVVNVAAGTISLKSLTPAIRWSC